MDKKGRKRLVGFVALFFSSTPKGVKKPLVETTPLCPNFAIQLLL